MFKNFSTRNRALFSAFMLSALYFVLHSQINFTNLMYSYDFGRVVLPMIISIIIFPVTLWCLHFNVRGERYITIALFSSLSSLIISLFFELIIFRLGVLGKISTALLSSLVLFVFNYIVILTINILNYSYINKIPLGQAGRSSGYIISLIIQYIGIFLIYSTQIHHYLRFLLVLILVFYYSYALLWGLELDLYKKVVSSLAISFTLACFGLVLNIWPISTYVVSLVLSIILYISFGVALEVKEKVGKFIWYEYGALAVLMFCIMLFFANWGINGSLI